MEVRSNCYQIIKFILGGWCILRLVGGGFVGALDLLNTLDIMVHVEYILEQ